MRAKKRASSKAVQKHHPRWTRAVPAITADNPTQVTDTDHLVSDIYEFSTDLRNGSDRIRLSALNDLAEKIDQARNAILLRLFQMRYPRFTDLPVSKLHTKLSAFAAKHRVDLACLEKIIWQEYADHQDLRLRRLQHLITEIGEIGGTMIPAQDPATAVQQLRSTITDMAR